MLAELCFTANYDCLSTEGISVNPARFTYVYINWLMVLCHYKTCTFFAREQGDYNATSHFVHAHSHMAARWLWRQ